MVVSNFLALQELTAAELNAHFGVFARKTADQTLTVSSTTLQNVTGLSASVAANTTYVLDAVFLYDTGTTPDIKFAFTFPSGATLSYAPDGYLSSGTNFESYHTGSYRQASGTAYAVAGLGSGTVVSSTVTGVLIVSSTAGTLQVQAAQNTSNASNTIVKADSWILLRKMS